MRAAIRILGFVLGLLLSAGHVPPALAATEAELSNRLAELKSQTREAGREFDRAYWELDETEVAIARSDVQLAKTRDELERSKAVLRRHVGAMYRRGPASIVAVVLGAESYTDLITRLDYIQRIGESDAAAVLRVKRLRTKLAAERRTLLVQRRTRSADVDRLRSRRDALQGRLDDIRDEYDRVKAQLDYTRTGGVTRQAGVLSMPGSNGMTFPVAGANYYADTWGASRGGGRRRHKGTDIMAATGVPCVAVSNGTVQSRSNGLGGMTIWLNADNGWSYYYAHLSGYAVTGGRVRAGQVIGYVGATGNAAGGAPHLHFEIHPGGGGAVNPYPYLRASE